MINTQEIKSAIKVWNKERSPYQRITFLYETKTGGRIVILVRRKKAFLRLLYEERNIGLPQCDLCAGKASLHISIDVTPRHGHHDGLILKSLRLAYEDHKKTCPQAQDLMRLAETIGRVK